MWTFIQHYAHAFLLRSQLMREITRAKREGYAIPISTYQLLKKPHFYQAYIWLYRFFKPSDKFILIDIGGNTGYWSQDFRRFFPGTKIYGFEPVKEVFEQYQQRYVNAPEVKVFNTALSFEPGEEVINVADGFGLTSFLQYGEHTQDLNKHFVREEKVKVDTLDHYFDAINSTENADRKKVVKIDVQGFEVNVLKGAAKMLHEVDALIIECSFINEFQDNNPTFPHLAKILIDYNLYPVAFGVYDYKKAAHGWERDVLFVRQDKLSKAWGY